MASLGFSTVAAVKPSVAAAPAPASGRGLRRAASARAPGATKSGGGPAAAAKEEKGLFDFIFGALYKEGQLLETDPLLNKVEQKKPAASAAAGKKAAAGNTNGGGGGGFNLGGLFAKKG